MKTITVGNKSQTIGKVRYGRASRDNKFHVSTLVMLLCSSNNSTVEQPTPNEQITHNLEILLTKFMVVL